VPLSRHASITRGSAAVASRLIGPGIREPTESRERKPHSTPKSEETMSQAVSTLLLRTCMTCSVRLTPCVDAQ